MEILVNNFNYWIYVILMMIGLFAMIAKNNLIKKLVGMTIFQTAIILFYVSIGVKHGATIPILSHDEVHGSHHEEAPAHQIEPGEAHEGEAAGGGSEPHDSPHHADLPSIDARNFANPIPHVLMLTAIVVGVSTLGVALSIAQRVHHFYGTVEEDEILKKIQLTDD